MRSCTCSALSKSVAASLAAAAADGAAAAAGVAAGAAAGAAPAAAAGAAAASAIAVTAAATFLLMLGEAKVPGNILEISFVGVAAAAFGATDDDGATDASFGLLSAIVAFNGRHAGLLVGMASSRRVAAAVGDTTNCDGRTSPSFRPPSNLTDGRAQLVTGPRSPFGQ